MAEIFGLASGVVGLASLFSTCLQMLETLNAARAATHDQHILFRKLDNQVLRFQAWGEALDLHRSGVRPWVLDADPVVAQGIHDTMQQIIALFKNGERLRSRYDVIARCRLWRLQCAVAADAVPGSRRLQAHARPVGRGLAPVLTTVGRRFRWVLLDRKAFEDLVTHLRQFNEDLVELSKTALQRRTSNQSVLTQDAVGDHDNDDDDDIESIRGHGHHLIMDKTNSSEQLPQVTRYDCEASLDLANDDGALIQASFSTGDETYETAMTS